MFFHTYCNMRIGVAPFWVIGVVGQLTAQIIASFLNNFPEFTCVFFVHTFQIIDLSLLFRVCFEFSYKILIINFNFIAQVLLWLLQQNSWYHIVHYKQKLHLQNYHILIHLQQPQDQLKHLQSQLKQ